jgi:hypothetical protein
VWLAGGEVKGGTVYGATDELVFKAAENRLTYHHVGRDFRLTDVSENLMREILV